MTLESLQALPAGDDDTHALVFYFLLEDSGNLRQVLRNGNHNASGARCSNQGHGRSLQTCLYRRVLSSGHGCGQIVADDDRNVGIFVNGVEQTGSFPNG